MKRGIRLTKIFAIVSNKGGVLKSTLTVNIGAELSRNYRVLLLDTDGQSNVAGTFGLIERNVKATLFSCLIGENSLEEAIENVAPNIDVVVAGELMNGYSNYTRQREISPVKLYNLVNEVKDSYDYIIIDTPPSKNDATLQAKLAADEIIIPFHPEGYDVAAIVATLDGITEVKEKTSKKLKVNSIVITKFDYRLSHHKKIAKDVQMLGNRLGIKIVKTRVPYLSSGGKSVVEEQLPTVLSKKWNKLKGIYANVAKEVVENG